MGMPSIHGRMARGVAWMIGFKVAERCLSFVSMIVLARVLVPADFGLIVLATSLIALIAVVGALGLDTSLIRQQNAGHQHFDAVWTFNVLFGTGVGLLAACAAPAAAWAYEDERLVGVVLLLALARAIGSFENPGIIGFRKDLQFDREVTFLLIKRAAASLVFTIPLALVLRSYWALVIGNLLGACFAVALSYVVHPYRPRFSIAGLGDLMGFSKWLLFSSILQFLHGRAADLIIGRMAGASALGAFTIAQEIARVPANEISAPVHRAVFPGYAQLAANRDDLRHAYLRVASLLVLIVAPAGTGLALLAEPAVRLLLGSAWMAAVPLIQLLAFNAILNVLLGSGHYVNLAVGMARSTSFVLAAHVAISLPLMLVMAPARGAAGAAAALLIASIMTAPLNFALLARAIRLDWRDILAFTWRPAFGTLIMSGALIIVRGQLGSAHDVSAEIGSVAVLVLLGIAVYVAVVLLLWWLQRRPDSAEAWVLRRLRDAVTVADRSLRARRARDR
jgi:O-antigen/teichoic acid export membrane protein